MKYKSNPLWIILSGRIEQFYRPWIIDIDKKSNTFSVSRRNWFFIGYDTSTYKISNIKNFAIDNNLFYSNIRIRIYYMEISCIGFDNDIVLRIKNELLNIN